MILEYSFEIHPSSLFLRISSKTGADLYFLAFKPLKSLDQQILEFRWSISSDHVHAHSPDMLSL